LLFGINYVRTPDAALRGCANDVSNMITFLKQNLEFTDEEIDFFVDTDPAREEGTTAKGIFQELFNMQSRSFSENLSHVLIHYSGHGASIRDQNGDENDGKDEALVPSDYRRSGLIRDDDLQRIFAGFNPNTHVTCIFDCCHSGTICDMPFQTRSKENVELHGADTMDSKCLMISGCKDVQTSADAFNVRGNREFTGALSSCLIQCWDKECQDDVFLLLEKIRAMLQEKRFTQVPQLCTTYDPRKNPRFW